MAFQATIKTEMGATIIHLSGALDESATIPSDLPSTGGDVYVDLQDMSYINSVGVRTWIRWIAEASRKNRIFLIRCPAVIVKNFSSIRGMLTKNTIVQSFYVPYYDEKQNHRNNVLYIRAQHFFEDGTIQAPLVKDSTGVAMEPDVIEQTYFSFLKL
jgi:anti-anti-sigma regulatory factor